MLKHEWLQIRLGPEVTVITTAVANDLVGQPQRTGVRHGSSDTICAEFADQRSCALLSMPAHGSADHRGRVVGLQRKR